MCFLIIQNNLKTKRKPVGKSLHLVGCFYLEKEFEPLVSVLICKRKRKQFFSFIKCMDAKETRKQTKETI